MWYVAVILFTGAELSERENELTGQARVYPDVNEKLGRSWWDYGRSPSLFNSKLKRADPVRQTT